MADLSAARDGGAQASGASDQAAISDDGRYTVYHSDAANLVAGDSNAVRDVFLYDRTAATTTRLSVSAGGTQGNGLSEDPAISGDGTVAAFESDATNLVAGDGNLKKDVFVRVLAGGAMERASVTSAGVEGNHTSREAAVSRDGRYVAFDSVASNLMAGDTNGALDIYVRDRTAGTTTLRSIASGGSIPGNGQSLNPAISSDGTTVAFESDATNLITDDTNAARDVFVRGPALDASTYAYDRLSRLTSVTGPDGPRTYAYDPAGNRSSRVLSGTTTAYTYDRADRISAAGAMAIAVNANGNTTAKGTDTFTFDQPNRLKTATVGGATETYVYDGDGTRFSRQLGAGSPIRSVSDVNRSLPVTIDDGTRKYVYGLGLAYAVSGTTLEVYHPDRLGSTRAITDAAGAVAATYRTDEWGVPTTTTGSSTQPFRFTGEPQDATGLVYLRARYYDPSLGRFLSRDTIDGVSDRPNSLNRYAYVANNPVTFADPSGHAAPGGSCASSVIGCHATQSKSKSLIDPVATLQGVFVAVVKCGWATYVVVQEGSSAILTGTSAAAFISGGELLPGANVVLFGVAATSYANTYYNLEYTIQTLQYCLGGSVPRAPSTMFLPPNFRP